ncbi:MAG: AAA family ATPase, partial [Proteobacteria bacterium]|nr:AAA family ATPase [Pseudomonadota bacterium]
LWAALRRMMYEDHFGLSQNPFQPVAEGEAIYEGPEQAKVIADLKIALTAKDSIAVLTGPVGVGKTTIVTHALEKMGSERLVARLGRTQVGSDELVDLLLAKFGIVREATRRFECLKTFNRILTEQAAAGARVFIVIEDAERLGVELLEELEALTATDDGASAGANIILMGPQKLDKLLTAPALERMRQRIRLQQALDRFTAEQVGDYLRHRITAAGGDFDALFEEETALMVRRCSGGIPRVINGLCETALTVAAEMQLSQVTPQTIYDVAVEVFGMEPGKAPPAPVAKPKQSAKSKALKATTPKMPAVKLPERAPDKPAPVAEKPRPPAETSTESTGPVKNMPAAPETKSEPQQTATPAAPEPSPPAADAPSPPEPEPQFDATVPGLPNLDIQKNAAAAAEAKPESHKPTPAPTPTPKFKFADDIVVDKNTRTNLRLEPAQTQATVPELPALNLKDGVPKIADEAPPTKKAPVGDIPTLGESSRIEKPTPTAEKPAPVAEKPVPVTEKPVPVTEKPAPVAEKPAPAAEAVPASSEVPSPPAEPSNPEVDLESTACFAKVDHDMLDAALADLAVHDEEDASESDGPTRSDKLEDGIPKMTLDKNLAAGRPAAKLATTAPAVPPKVAAEMEKNKAANQPAAKAEIDPSVPPRVAAEMEKNKAAKQAVAKEKTEPSAMDKLAAEAEKAESLEDVSDKLAETLFGSEELEAISLQIREKAQQKRLEAKARAAGDDAAPSPTPEAAQANAETKSPSAPEAPTAAKPAADGEEPLELVAEEPVTPKPEPDAEKPPEPAAKKPEPPKPPSEPETIESQFSKSMTKTLKILDVNAMQKLEEEEEEETEEDGDDTKAFRAGLWGRLIESFKS